MPTETQEKYAEQFNVKVRIDMNISPVKNAVLVSKNFADSMIIYKTHEFVAKSRKATDRYGEYDIFTNDIPGVSKEQTRCLNENGIIALNTEVSTGDILVGIVHPNSSGDLTYEKKLFNALFGDKPLGKSNNSVYVPKNVSGVVTDIKIETRKENPKIEKYTKQVVKVFVRQPLPLMIGDIVEDNNGNKGIVVGYIDNDDSDIISNFNFDGSKVIRNSSIIELQAARGTGKYNFFGRPAFRGLYDDPQKLSLINIIKIIKSGHLKDLICLAVGSNEPIFRSKIYDGIIRGSDISSPINTYFITKMLCFLNAAGVKCVIHYASK